MQLIPILNTPLCLVQARLAPSGDSAGCQHMLKVMSSHCSSNEQLIQVVDQRDLETDL